MQINLLNKADWSSEPETSYSFLTDIVQAQDGAEQRVALRNHPRKTFTYLYTLEGLQAAEFKHKLRSWSDTIYLVPDFNEVPTFKSDENPESYIIPVLPDANGFEGYDNVLIGDEIYELNRYSGQSSTNITIEPALSEFVSAGTPVYRLNRCAVITEPSFLQLTSSVLQVSVKFEVLPDWFIPRQRDKQIPAEAAYGIPVLTLRPNRSRDITARLKSIYEQFDPGPGLYRREPIHDYTVTDCTWDFYSLSQITEFKRLMYATQGSCGQFFAETENDDIYIAADLDGVSTDLVAVKAFLTEAGAVGRYIAITLADGSKHYRKITNCVPGDTTETLTLDTAPPAATTSQVARISWLDCCRFLSDEFRFKHHTDEAAQITKSIKTTKKIDE